MRVGILLFRPSVLFFALALVVFVTMVALNTGETSAAINCAPDNPNDCSGGTGGPGGGTGGNVSCSTPGDRDSCTFSGGAGVGGAGGAGGRVDIGERTEDDCVLVGHFPDEELCKEVT
jgi:hypothetical protein